MRVYLAAILCSGLLSAGCDKPADDETTPAATSEARDTFQAQLDYHSPYAGEWASARGDCDDEKKLWTIEARRMAIVPSMRFCAFNDIVVNENDSSGDRTWSATARCLAEGRESRDFLFFRLEKNLREMRVTINDSRSVELVRCLKS